MAKLSHGASTTKEYAVWQTMKARCKNPNNKQFKDYGERGIIVCDEWANSFEAFISDMGKCPQGFALDRIDNNKGYFKENCRWTTISENNRNKRNNRFYDVDGETLCLVDIAKKYNIQIATLRARLDVLGWTIEQAIAKEAYHASEYCKMGHKWEPETTYIDKRGHRFCRLCARIKDKLRRPAKGTAKTAYLKRERDERGKFK